MIFKFVSNEYVVCIEKTILLAWATIDLYYRGIYKIFQKITKLFIPLMIIAVKQRNAIL
jgi:hypothetical protein